MSSLTNSNPLMTSGLLDDFQPKPKQNATPVQSDDLRADKLATRQAAQDRGFVIDNLATVVKARRSSSGKASTDFRPGATTTTTRRHEDLSFYWTRFFRSGGLDRQLGKIGQSLSR
jgi:hypothetical protein